jgi:DNA-binding MarR family transcriptional regulator
MFHAPTIATQLGTTDADGSSVFAWSASERAALDLWSDLLRVTGTVRGLLAERLDTELGMVPEEVDLLMRLEEAPEQRLRMADVSRSLQLSKSGVTRLVDRLAERGLVERAACPSDRRVVYAGLTAEGRRAVAEAAPLLVAGVVGHLADHLKARELDALQSSLRKIIAAEGTA